MTDQPDGNIVPRLGSADEAELFARFRSTGDRRVRNEIVERHLGLAIHIAQRYTAGRSNDDDLRQVAMLGLVKAVDRFDPSHGSAFSSFAGSTIEGELKRYFRDRTWTVRVPRSAQELHLAVRGAIDELTQRLGQTPTIDQVQAHLRVDRDDVLRGLAATAAYSVGTLDAPGADADPSAVDRQRALSADEDGFERSDDQSVVAALLVRLPEREQQIVRLRFFDGMSQSEIADEMGMSQMHVSRLLRRSFEQMRAWMVDAADSSDADR